MGTPDTGRFQINDIELYIPPDQIQVDRQAINNYWETLRTRSSIKTRSGFAFIEVQLHVMFTDNIREGEHRNGLQQLCDLVSQFRITPFAWIENQYLRDAILGGRTGQAMALALTNIEISKVADPDNVNTVEAYMKFQWFNYLPYMREFLFREDLFSPTAVSNPKKSKAWKMLYQAEQKKNEYFREIKDLGKDLPFKMAVRQFALFPKEQYIKNQQELAVLNKIKDLLAKKGDKGDHTDPDDTLATEGGVPADFIAAAKGTMDDAAALAFLQSLFGHTTTAEQNGSSPGEEFDLNELADITKDNIQSRTKYLEEYKWGMDPKFGWTAVDVENAGAYSTLEYSSYLSDKLVDMANKWQKKESNGSVMMKRTEIMDPADFGVIVTGISISFQNSLAMMPVIGHPYPTFQHTGSMDAVVSVSMTTAQQIGLQYMTDMYTMYEDQARKYKEIPAGQKNIHIKNDLVNMCGLHEFILETMHTETVPGQPGTSNIIMKLVDNPLTSSTRENITFGQSFTAKFEIRKMIVDVLNGFLDFNTAKPAEFYAKLGRVRVKDGQIQVEVKAMDADWAAQANRGGEPSPHEEMVGPSSVGKDIFLYNYKGPKDLRHERLKETVEKYNHYLSNAVTDLCGLFDAGNIYKKASIYREKFPAFFLLTDREVLGIERLQKDITPLLEQVVAQDKTSGLAILFNRENIPAPERRSVVIDSGVGFHGATSVGQGQEAWSKEEIERNRNILSLWQELQKGTAADFVGPGSDIYQDAISNSYQQRQTDNRKVIETFVEDNLRQFNSAMVTFIDWIMRSDVMDLPEFTKVREKLKANSTGTSSDAYPDFPFDQLVSDLKTNRNEIYKNVIKQLEQASFLEGYGLRNISLSSMLNPDCYVYNSYVTGAADPISETVMKSAQQAISSGQYGTGFDSRQGQEKDYLTKSYVSLIGTGKNSAILASRQEGLGALAEDGPKAQKKINEKRTVLEARAKNDPVAAQQLKYFNEQEKKYQSTTNEGAYLAADTLQGTIRSSIHERQGSAKPLSAITDANAGYMAGNIRGESTLAPSASAATVCHFLSTDDPLKNLGESAYKPPTESKGTDPKKEPVFRAPVVAAYCVTSDYDDMRVGISARRHTGIDLAANTGGNAASAQMDVVAAADGVISYVTPEFKVENYTYGSKNPDITNEKLKNKAVETTVTVKVTHDGGYMSVYKHMQWDAFMQDLSNKFNRRMDEANRASLTEEEWELVRHVKAGDPLGKIGTTGWSTGEHLHFEIWKGSSTINPREKIEGIPVSKSRGPIPWINPDSESIFSKSVEQLEKEMISQGYSFMRAYPTFRLYFIESDLGERKRFGFDDFFAYSSVQEITMIRSRKIAADLAIIKLTNISGVLTNRKFKESPLASLARDAQGNIVQKNGKDPGKTGTIYENPIASLMLQPGVQIQLRLGYSNNPDDLEKVFNGVITDVEVSGAEDIVEITCQSYGIELVQNVFGEAKKFGAWYHPDAGMTPDLLEELMASPEVVHFGRWEGGEPATAISYGLLQKRWKFKPTPADDNIFAPCKNGIMALFDDAPKYTAFNTTIWDVFQEMTLRHPGYVAQCVPYDEEGMARMTMFFGVPDQLYFARDPTTRENNMMTDLKKMLNQQKDAWKNVQEPIDQARDATKNPEDMDPDTVDAIDSIQRGWKPAASKEMNEFVLRTTLLNYAKDRGFVKPFRNYHVLTSTNHILQNTVTSSVWDTFNVATLQYEDDGSPKVNEATSELEFKDAESFTMELDAAMPDEEKRELFAQYHNCTSYNMAKCYCIALLAQSLREGYRGSVTVIGNPKIKPYDICYIFDEFTDMFGPMEVEQVVHRFSKRDGFITEITPDMCIHVNQSSTMGTMDAMGLMAEYKLRQMGLQSIPSILASFRDQGIEEGLDKGQAGNGLIAKTLALGTGLASRAVGATAIGAAFFFAPGASLVAGVGSVLGSLGGSFILRKYITRTQTANAIRYSPLVLHNKPMIGGFPARKMDNGFLQNIKDKVAKWTKEAGDGMPLYIDHLSYKLDPNNWIRPMGKINW
jgi:murein DD-endopeptidase MepM/ murein hydrolase activator NlpD